MGYIRFVIMLVPILLKYDRVHIELENFPVEATEMFDGGSKNGSKTIRIETAAF